MKLAWTRRETLILVVVAALAMVALDLYLLFGLQQNHPENLKVVDSAVFVRSEIADFETAMNAQADWKHLNVPEPVPEKYSEEPFGPHEQFGPARPAKPKPKIVAVPEPLRHEGEPAKIVIIIDDMGMDKKHSHQVIDLAGPLTLAFLPYATNLDAMAQEANAQGHELMIHMPMQPIDKTLNPGPIALRYGMSGEEIDAMLDKAFNSFSGYKGLNNHMGSGLTQDRAAMKRVMAALKTRGLYFVDSKTIGYSVAGDEAAQAEIRHADRDVFLDHQETLPFARSALRQLERVASKKGYAIAIGHPKEITITALKEWLPTLETRGFELVPASDVVRRTRMQVATEDEAKAAAEIMPASSGPASGPASGLTFGPVQSPAPPPGSPLAPY